MLCPLHHTGCSLWLFCCKLIHAIKVSSKLQQQNIYYDIVWVFLLLIIFQIDMPLVVLYQQWWCIILMENFDLGRWDCKDFVIWLEVVTRNFYLFLLFNHFLSHGKLFAHWTDASKALLRGEVPPVFRLMKRKVDDITEVRFLFCLVLSEFSFVLSQKQYFLYWNCGITLKNMPFTR